MTATAVRPTRQDLERCERELVPLHPGEGASARAREDARAFNAELDDLRQAVLEPLRGLLERGTASPELGACAERAVVELAFWRRVLVRVHPSAFRPAEGSRDFLLRWLLS